MGGAAPAADAAAAKAGELVIDGPAAPEQPNVMARDAELQVDDPRDQAARAAQVRRPPGRRGLRRVSGLRRDAAGVAALQPAVHREDRDLGDVRRRQHLRRRASSGTTRRPRSGSPTSCAATPTRCGRTITSASASTPSTIAAAASCSTRTRWAGFRITRSSTRARPTPTGTRCGTCKTGRFDGGWTIEMQFPFKSLRYTSGPDQVWGIQFRRSIRHKNEWTYWTPVPQNMAGPGALNRVSAYGTRRRPRSAARRPEPRAQAVRARQDEHGSPDESADDQRS